MPAPTQCGSSTDFLISLSPALSALLSAIALWVGSRARITSRAAQQTSQAALKISHERAHSSSVIVSDRVVQALKNASSKEQGRNE
jgi:hypothetical protein